jgi:hypothetical protein
MPIYQLFLSPERYENEIKQRLEDGFTLKNQTDNTCLLYNAPTSLILIKN